MERLIKVAVRLVRAAQRVTTRKWSFFGVFAVMFLGSVYILGQLDLLPDTSAPVSSTTALVSTSEILATSTSAAAVVEEPIKIEIAKINLSASITNPTTTDIASLDEDLLSGAVRYPTSAKLGEVGNVILFGHSSYLPIVRNQAYKTFNGIQKLVRGDVVTVYASGTAYTYKVRSVAKESAVDAGIPLQVDGRVLTLSTCDSFGKKTDRFVVTADFVESHPAGS